MDFLVLGLESFSIAAKDGQSALELRRMHVVCPEILNDESVHGLLPSIETIDDINFNLLRKIQLPALCTFKVSYKRGAKGVTKMLVGDYVSSKTYQICELKAK